MSLPSSDGFALRRLPNALMRYSLVLLVTVDAPTVQVSPLLKLAVTVPGSVDRLG
jgi:hypothetical protein